VTVAAEAGLDDSARELFEATRDAHRLDGLLDGARVRNGLEPPIGAG
jgi:hypothetical protein